MTVLGKQQALCSVLIRNASGIQHCISSALFWFQPQPQWTVCENSGFSLWLGLHHATTSCRYFSILPLGLSNPRSPSWLTLSRPKIYGCRRNYCSKAATQAMGDENQTETVHSSIFLVDSSEGYHMCFSEFLVDSLNKASYNGFLLFAWSLYSSIAAFER